MATLGLTEEQRQSMERFEAEVIAPSMQELVILDFWAEWCGPCKQLGPVLDKIASDYADKGVRLAKIDVDADKALAAQFQIQSIPTVYAIYQGQPVANLTNYRTEGQLTKVIDQLLTQLRIVPSGAAPKADIEPLLAMGEQVLGEGDSARAVSIFRQIVDLDPDSAPAHGGLMRALIAAGEMEEAKKVGESVPDKIAAKPEVARARAALDIAETDDGIDTGDLERKIAAVPDDHQSRFELANAYMASGKRDEAADALLAIIGADREWNDGAARQTFLKLLEAQGIEDPWSSTQRRRLSAVLFT